MLNSTSSSLAETLLVFGSPSHRIEPQLESTAKLFDLPVRFAHTGSPGCVQVSFGVPEQKASETLLITSKVGLNLCHIHEPHAVYTSK